MPSPRWPPVAPGVLTRSYASSQLAVVGTESFRSFDFISSGRSAAVGVLSQGGETAGDFYDVNLDRLHEAYSDGFVDFVVVDTGSGAVPHLSREWLEEYAKVEVRSDGGRGFTLPGERGLDTFSRRWFRGYDPIPSRPNEPIPSNYLHAVGSGDNPSFVGLASRGRAWVQVYSGALERMNGSPGSAEVVSQQQHVVAHEIGHQFRLSVNHDTRRAWCEANGHCGAPPNSVPDGGLACLMTPVTPVPVLETKFCIEDLLLGDPAAAPDVNGRQPLSIRGMEDPL
jgi:hypothetical protein